MVDGLPVENINLDAIRARAPQVWNDALHGGQSFHGVLIAHSERDALCDAAEGFARQTRDNVTLIAAFQDLTAERDALCAELESVRTALAELTRPFHALADMWHYEHHGQTPGNECDREPCRTHFAALAREAKT